MPAGAQASGTESTATAAPPAGAAQALGRLDSAGSHTTAAHGARRGAGRGRRGSTGTAGPAPAPCPPQGDRSAAGSQGSRDGVVVSSAHSAAGLRPLPSAGSGGQVSRAAPQSATSSAASQRSSDPHQRATSSAHSLPDMDRTTVADRNRRPSAAVLQFLPGVQFTRSELDESLLASLPAQRGGGADDSAPLSLPTQGNPFSWSVPMSQQAGDPAPQSSAEVGGAGCTAPDQAAAAGGDPEAAAGAEALEDGAPRTAPDPAPQCGTDDSSSGAALETKPTSAQLRGMSPPVVAGPQLGGASCGALPPPRPDASPAPCRSPPYTPRPRGSPAAKEGLSPTWTPRVRAQSAARAASFASEPAPAVRYTSARRGSGSRRGSSPASPEPDAADWLTPEEERAVAEGGFAAVLRARRRNRAAAPNRPGECRRPSGAGLGAPPRSPRRSLVQGPSTMTPRRAATRQYSLWSVASGGPEGRLRPPQRRSPPQLESGAADAVSPATAGPCSDANPRVASPERAFVIPPDAQFVTLTPAEVDEAETGLDEVKKRQIQACSRLYRDALGRRRRRQDDCEAAAAEAEFMNAMQCSFHPETHPPPNGVFLEAEGGEVWERLSRPKHADPNARRRPKSAGAARGQAKAAPARAPAAAPAPPTGGESVTERLFREAKESRARREKLRQEKSTKFTFHPVISEHAQSAKTRGWEGVAEKGTGKMRWPPPDPPFRPDISPLAQGTSYEGEVFERLTCWDYRRRRLLYAATRSCSPSPITQGSPQPVRRRGRSPPRWSPPPDPDPCDHQRLGAVRGACLAGWLV
eukprot:TRINITY_DN35058_c0_g1_i1.p1 TRINITY_DN35058_c0_g1~~TRINITY_DN35058_c0_g1_i1.p1  ORF type:complete len:824 (+),score=159.17 TRINITY_DN35058_c0_g1_i1:53-2473(+)